MTSTIYKVDYRGTTQVTSMSSKPGALEANMAIQTIMSMSKTKLESMLEVSQNGVRIHQNMTHATLLDCPIPKVVFCGPDVNDAKKVIWIVKSTDGNNFYAHLLKFENPNAQMQVMAQFRAIATEIAANPDKARKSSSTSSAGSGGGRSGGGGGGQHSMDRSSNRTGVPELEDPWFQGTNLSKQDCLDILQDEEAGAFIICESESSPGDYSITVALGCGSKPYRGLIKAIGKGKFKLGKSETTFRSICELVEHYGDNVVTRDSNKQEVMLDWYKKGGGDSSRGGSGGGGGRAKAGGGLGARRGSKKVTSKPKGGAPKDMSWYRPDLTKEEATQHVEAMPVVGGFCIRESDSQPGAYVLQSWMGEKVNKILINPTSGGYRLGKKDKNVFRTIDDLVWHFSKNQFAKDSYDEPAFLVIPKRDRVKMERAQQNKEAFDEGNDFEGEYAEEEEDDWDTRMQNRRSQKGGAPRGLPAGLSFGGDDDAGAAPRGLPAGLSFEDEDDFDEEGGNDGYLAVGGDAQGFEDDFGDGSFSPPAQAPTSPVASVADVDNPFGDTFSPNPAPSKPKSLQEQVQSDNPFF